MLTAAAERVADTAFAQWAMSSPWAYPAANLIHLLGLVLLLGGIGIVDLRIAGFFHALPLDPLIRALTPFAISGLLLMVVSGPVLFAADATALARSATFGWKLALILVALANALSFRWLRRSNRGPPTTLERMLAIISLLLWLNVAALGRMIAYN